MRNQGEASIPERNKNFPAHWHSCSRFCLLCGDENLRLQENRQELPVLGL